MSSFQEEIHQMQRNRQEQMDSKRDPTGKGLFRAESETYIDYACDAIRVGIKLKVMDGLVQYDRRSKTAFCSERKTNPHYGVYWCVACYFDFTKDDFYWDAQKRTLKMSEADTLLYVLDEMQSRLAKDGIYPVEHRKRMFGPWKQYEKTETVKSRLCCPNVCREFQEAAAEYARGVGRAEAWLHVGSHFAYFLENG